MIKMKFSELDNGEFFDIKDRKYLKIKKVRSFDTPELFGLSTININNKVTMESKMSLEDFTENMKETEEK